MSKRIALLASFIFVLSSQNVSAGSDYDRLQADINFKF